MCIRDSFVVGCDGSLVQVLSDFLGGSSLEGSWCGHDDGNPRGQTMGLRVCVVPAICVLFGGSKIKAICVVGEVVAEAQKDGLLFCPSGSKPPHFQGGEQSLDPVFSHDHASHVRLMILGTERKHGANKLLVR